MPREWKTSLDQVQVASYKALCERLEAIVDQLEKLNANIKKGS
jgi:hypothetical protein